MLNKNRSLLRKISSNLTVSPAVLIIATGVWLATVGNIPLWKTLLQLQEEIGVTFFIGFLVAVAALNISLLSIFALGPLLKPVLVGAILVNSITSYFMLSYGIVIDPGMIRNTLQTDIGEAIDLLSYELLVTVLGFSIIPIFLIILAGVKKTTAIKAIFTSVLLAFLGLALALVCIFLIYQPFSSTMRNHTKMRYQISPLNTFYSTIKVATNPLDRRSLKIEKIGQDAKIQNNELVNGEEPILLLIVGETARAENFGINGYERNTTPLLSKRADIFSSKNAWSCGTSTAESLPCMFSHLDREDYASRKVNHENMLDVLAKAGLSVYWLDNQSGCKGVCARVATEYYRYEPSNPLCEKDGVCQDSAMLVGLKDRIQSSSSMKNGKGKVIVLHQMGSHGPAYYKRSSLSRKTFKPECESAALQSCTQQEVVNAYDNSIIETDYFINNAIDWLKNSFPAAPTALMYVSDHGESLGENNIYLHGLPYSFAPKGQKNIPWVMWVSKPMEISSGTSLACLKSKNLNIKISHDNYFHTVLGLLDVQTNVYDKTLDIAASCTSEN